MKETKVVHCKRDKYDVYIGRPSKWGNPFKLSNNQNDRYLVIRKYIDWLRGESKLIEAARKELKGKILGCWCSPKLCHGNVLARVADGEEIHEDSLYLRYSQPHRRFKNS